MKILILDDNPDMLASLGLILERAGFETELARSSEDAFRAQSRRPADVFITDIFMPDIDGLRTIEEFRARWPALRIIAMSGGGETVKGDYLAVAAQIGADLTLRKPFDPAELLSALSGRSNSD
jgi:DNA-binding response OmpR family regulator